jgi:LysM repeat protein
MSVRRMLPFIFINIIVSATVVLAILFWWDSREGVTMEATQVVPTPSPRVITQVTAATTEEALGSSSLPEALDDRITYTVQAGDSLSLISQQFDILLIDLMEANGITDANVVIEGQILVIPVIGEDTPAPTPTETPSFDTVPTPIPTLPSSGAVFVEITEVMSPGDLNEERLTIVNSGERQIDLSNWSLEDQEGNVYVFGTVTLFGNGVELIVHTRLGQSGLLDQFWGLNEAIWQPGETAILKDAEGTIRASMTVPGS